MDSARLERLFLLLDRGSTLFVRRSAAEQIGSSVNELAGARQRHHACSLIPRLRPLLKSLSWDTRIAAGYALEQIARQIPQIVTPGVSDHEQVVAQSVHDAADAMSLPAASGSGQSSETKREEEQDDDDDMLDDPNRPVRLHFADFHINRVIDKGHPLYASGGDEFNADWRGVRPDKMLKVQRRHLKQRLGLYEEMGTRVSRLIEDDDLIVHPAPAAASTTALPASAAVAAAADNKMDIREDLQLTARERNRLRRLAKQHASSIQPESPFDIAVSRSTSAHTVSTSMPHTSDAKMSGRCVDSSCSFEGSAAEPILNDWMFGPLSEELMWDLFDARWTIRHGAAVGLRALLRHQGASAGMRGVRQLHTSVNTRANDVDVAVHGSVMDIDCSDSAWKARIGWLNDCAIRLLCVFALDRFADYTGDTMIAPVRETAGQALGLVLRQLSTRSVEQVASSLLTLAQRSEWDLRHGGFLGLKYLVAVRIDVAGQLCQEVVQALRVGLKDDSDDVRAMAADSIGPFIRVFDDKISSAIAAVSTPAVPQALNMDVLALSLLHSAWNALLGLDELSGAAVSVLNALHAMHAQPHVHQLLTSASVTAVANKLPAGLGAGSKRARPGVRAANSTGDLPSAKRQHVSETIGIAVVGDAVQGSLSALIPRLYPYVRHVSGTAQLAVMKLIQQLLISSLPAEFRPPAPSFHQPDWLMPSVATDLLNLCLQNLVLDDSDDDALRRCTLHVWKLLCTSLSTSHLSDICSRQLQSWLSLTNTPVGSPLDASLRVERLAAHPLESEMDPAAPADIPAKDKRSKKASRAKAQSSPPSVPTTAAVKTLAVSAIDTSTGSVNQTLYRMMWTCRALGFMLRYIPKTMDYSLNAGPAISEGSVVTNRIRNMLQSDWACQRYCAAMLLAQWHMHDAIRDRQDANSVVSSATIEGLDSAAWPAPLDAPAFALSPLLELVQVNLDEQKVKGPNVFAELSALRSVCYRHSLTLLATLLGSAPSPPPAAIAVEQSVGLVTKNFDTWLSSHSVTAPAALLESAQQQRSVLARSLRELDDVYQQWWARTQSGMAACLVFTRCLPTRVTPIIVALTNCLKQSTIGVDSSGVESTAARTDVMVVANQAANTLAELMRWVAFDRFDESAPSVLPTTQSSSAAAVKMEVAEASPSPNTKLVSNVLVMFQRPLPVASAVDRYLSAHSTSPASESSDQEPAAHPDMLELQRIAANSAVISGVGLLFKHLPRVFQDRLFDGLPAFRNKFAQCFAHRTSLGISAINTDSMTRPESADSQECFTLLRVLQALAPVLHQRELTTILDWLPGVCRSCLSDNVHLRHQAVLTLNSLFNRSCTPMGPLPHQPESVLASLLNQGVPFIESIVCHVLPSMDDPNSGCARLGGCELLRWILRQQSLQPLVLPYLVLFVQPLLARLSDPVQAIRRTASEAFSTAVALIPVEANAVHPGQMNPQLVHRRAEERVFLQQLTSCNRSHEAALPVRINAELRRYQQEGVSWLLFLQRFHLGGILCDDMGLGKTLQTICAIAAEHYGRQQEAKSTAPDSGKSGRSTKVMLPSLIVCPPTVTSHWFYEILKFDPRPPASEPPSSSSTPALSSEKQAPGVLHPVLYAGKPAERRDILNKLLQQGLPCRDAVLISSYETVRNDIATLSSVNFNYIILDEGHIIRNSRSALFAAVKRLRADHRLILSGTPLQNNVLELWSLFEFLMPGYLGPQAVFDAQYSRVIQAAASASGSRSSGGAVSTQSGSRKRSRAQGSTDGLKAEMGVNDLSSAQSPEMDAATEALESLHRKVLPFLLRRLKEDVLADLPPKIIQDYYCELSPLQARLYSDFTRTAAFGSLMRSADASGSIERVRGPNEASSSAQVGGVHMFQALHYLRRLCAHPALVFSPAHPQYTAVLADMRRESSVANLHELSVAPKLMCLREILSESGIPLSKTRQGDQATTEAGGDAPSDTEPFVEAAVVESVTVRHRALVFAQTKSLLDLVEKDLFRPHMAGLRWLRIDGDIKPAARFAVVQKFNEDSTIDVLLLTTQVGGLGLNLTGADTVVFLEHDWNPMKDLQAMDRAHRIGQRRTVNVYRILTRDTLEERIMGLQAFKRHVAGAVITSDNAQLQTMQTEKLLDMLQAASSDGHSNATQRSAASTSGDDEAARQAAIVEASLNVSSSLASVSAVTGVDVAVISGTIPEEDGARTVANYADYDISQFIRSLS